MIICYYTVEWQYADAFRPSSWANHQCAAAFLLQQQTTFCLACVQVGMLQLNEIAAACVGWMNLLDQFPHGRCHERAVAHGVRPVC